MDAPVDPTPPGRTSTPGRPSPIPRPDDRSGDRLSDAVGVGDGRAETSASRHDPTPRNDHGNQTTALTTDPTRRKDPGAAGPVLRTSDGSRTGRPASDERAGPGRPRRAGTAHFRAGDLVPWRPSLRRRRHGASTRTVQFRLGDRAWWRTILRHRHDGASARTAHGRPAPLHGVPLVVCAVPVAVALVAAMVLAVSIGSVHVPVGDVWGIVLDRLGLDGTFDPTYEQIVWQYRVPRVLLAALAGAGLSVSGAVLQAVVGNPLADPHALGIAPGASLGAALALTGGLGAAGGLGVSAAAFAGAVLAAVLVFALGQRQGRLLPVRLVLAGVAVAYLFTALTSYVQIQATPNELSQIMFWLLGSVSGAQWSQLRTVGLLVVVATVGLTAFGRRLNVLVGGDESAVALGVDVHRARVVLLGLASLLTGVVISVAGGILFVGLMVPHLVRLAVGADHRRVLPLTALLGATYLVTVDLLSRTVDRPNELPLGIFTATCGAPFFVWLLRRNQSVA